MAYRRRKSPYLKTHQVAEALGVSLCTVYNWLNAGHIPEPQRSVTGHRMWTEADIQAIRAIAQSAERARRWPNSAKRDRPGAAA